MGIEHVLLPEQGLVAPGDVVIGADCHTCTYGALGAFSTGVGSTDFAAAMAWGRVWLRVPETIKFVYSGRPQPWVTGKDLILHTIGLIGVDGALYQAMEFTGEAIEALSMDDRFTMCNMAIEAGGKSGIVGFDEKTTQYLRSGPEGSRARTAGEVFASDADAEYARVIEIDAARRAAHGGAAAPAREHGAGRRPGRRRRSTRSSSAPAPTAASRTCARRPRILRGQQGPPATCAASSSRARSRSAWTRSPTAPCRRSSRPAAPSARRPAAPASAGTWASSPRASAPSPPPTATSSAAWATPRARSTWPARTWPPPPPWPATSPRPKQVGARAGRVAT